MVPESLLFEISGNVWEVLLSTAGYLLVTLLFSFLLQLELTKGVFFFLKPVAKIAVPLLIFLGWAVMSWQLVSVIFYFKVYNWQVVTEILLMWTFIFVVFNLLVDERRRGKKS